MNRAERRALARAARAAPPTRRRIERPLTDPFLVARDHATTLSDGELAGMAKPIRTAFTRLRAGQAAADDWCVLAGSLGVAQNIERQGVVRGLAGHLQAADAALVAIEHRAMASGTWRAPTLYGAEIDAIDTFVDLHLFQLRQLSYGEFRRAYLVTEGQVKSRGGQVARLGAGAA